MFGKSRERTSHPTTTTVSQTAQPNEPAPKQKRPLLMRLFGLRFWGAVRLILLCVLVGIIMKIGGVTQQPQEFSLLNSLAEIWQNTLAGFLWLIRNGWLPALMGATVVLPIWVLWRLVSLPFRR
ncbi:MAG: hypothetical protein CMK07_08925 [Ponticaulis sp.]|nr:hypothetical protein [Ponticaulis sp.]